MLRRNVRTLPRRKKRVPLPVRSALSFVFSPRNITPHRPKEFHGYWKHFFLPFPRQIIQTQFMILSAIPEGLQHLAGCGRRLPSICFTVDELDAIVEGRQAEYFEADYADGITWIVFCRLSTGGCMWLVSWQAETAWSTTAGQPRMRIKNVT